MSEIDLQTFASKDALTQAATRFLSQALKGALQDRGQASLMLSGGSSPKPVYDALATENLDWDGVAISLVDERWVPSGAPGSNADFLQACFANTAASRSHFTPLYNGFETASAGINAAEQALALMPQPFDVCVMGMGLDGHTASWFPNSGGLKAALDPQNDATVCAIDATGCPVAGDHTDRITLTYSAVARSRNVMLLLPSAEKLDVFRLAANKAVNDAPVKALYNLKNKLTVFALEIDS